MGTSEPLASWFFRLNGCATIENFIVHPDSRRESQRTDVDVLGVRFPHRAERAGSATPFKDHRAFCEPDDVGRLLIILAEVKTGRCALNGPWTDPSKGNMQRVLRAVGAFPEQEVEFVARGLYESGAAHSGAAVVKMFAIGAEVSPDGALPSGCVPITWLEILEFIHQRMTRYWAVKAHHDQWDKLGRELYETAVNTFFDDVDGFARHWMVEVTQRGGA